MKKTVFTLGAITAVCACGLVIDPDKLVEGNGAGDPDSSLPDGGGDVTAPEDAGADVVVDATADGPTFVEIPECVPRAPTATEGPYAVTFAKAPATPVCPTGYLATPLATAKNNLFADGIVCGSSAGCTCASPSGTPTCSFRVSYYNEATCATPAGSDSVSASCRDLDSNSYLKVVTTVSGVNCSSTGASTVTPTAKPTPSFLETWVVCQPDPGVQLAQCKSDQVALPPAKDAGACVITTAPSCPAPYTESIALSKSGTFTDQRSCACSCGGAPSSCTGGSATIFSESTCMGGTSAPLDVDTCKPRNGNDGLTVVNPTPGAAACAAKASPSGSYAPNNDLRLCCLP